MCYNVQHFLGGIVIREQITYGIVHTAVYALACRIRHVMCAFAAVCHGESACKRLPVRCREICACFIKKFISLRVSRFNAVLINYNRGGGAINCQSIPCCQY